MVETEIKLRFTGAPQEARELIERHGYAVIEPRTLEADQTFDHPNSELRSGDQLLRLRRAGGRFTVTYKGPAAKGRHKSREEIEFDVSDAENFELVLQRLGYQPRFRYEKYRTKFGGTDAQGIVMIDETPIGVFLELEGTAEWIDRTAAGMGFSPAEYCTASYAALYREYLLSHKGCAGNMVFGSEHLPETPGKDT